MFPPDRLGGQSARTRPECMKNHVCLVFSLSVVVGCNDNDNNNNGNDMAQRPADMAVAGPANQQLKQTNLVSDQVGMAAHTDPNLVN